MAIDSDLVIVAIRRAAGLPSPEPPALPSYAAAEPEAAALRREWLRVKDEIELAMQYGQLPGYGHVFAPHIETLQGLILDRWGCLAEQGTFEDCLRLIAKTAGNAGAQVLGYECLRAALVMAHHTGLAERVGDLLVALLTGCVPQEGEDAAQAGPADLGRGAPVSPRPAATSGEGGARPAEHAADAAAATATAATPAAAAVDADAA